MRVVGNLFARAASHGAQVRGGGLLEDNLFLDNAIAGFVAAGRSGEASATIRLNVVLGGRDISPQLRRGWGLSVIASPVVVFEHNLVAHRTPGVGDGWPYELQYDPGRPPPTSISWHHNAAHRWGGDTTSNRAHLPGSFPVLTSGFPDPARTLDAYCLKNGLPDLLTPARNRPRGTWPPELSPRVVNAWLRAGFLPTP